MMGLQPTEQQSALFYYHINLEHRLSADHLLRKVNAKLDLSFVPGMVRHCYGRSGNTSLDPRVVMKMMLLLFLYNIRSERELMEQIAVRMDFLWFLGFDLETPIPDHSVLSKARARWGSEVFEKLFGKTVRQCVEAGLVDGRLLHVDSTMVKANASRDSVIPSGPELVQTLREVYQQQASKLEVIKEPAVPAPAHETKAPPVNSTHVSSTDPQAELAKSKNGVTELNYKDHRLVDDSHGVITAISATAANVPDGKQLPDLYEQHLLRTSLERPDCAIAGDHHYGTAENYIYCSQQEVRAHLGARSASLKERGLLAVSEFTYEPAKDRLRCPKGHYLVLHQQRPEEYTKTYLIEDEARCASCPLREQCTRSKRGRSVTRHVQADLIEEAKAQASSPAGKYNRKRRQHVMEGSFADAVNNHGAKKARWRGLWRQQIQSWIIAAVQNLRLLLRNEQHQPRLSAVIVPLNGAQSAGQTVRFWLQSEVSGFFRLASGILDEIFPGKYRPGLKA